MRLTSKFLRQVGACEEGWKFFELNFPDGIDRDQISGEFLGWIAWIDNKLKSTFTYDERGNILTKTEPDGWKWTYTYDERGNRLTMTDTNGDTTTYTYDERGNRLTKTNQYGETWKYSYKYDEKCRLVEATDYQCRTSKIDWRVR